MTPFSNAVAVTGLLALLGLGACATEPRAAPVGFGPGPGRDALLAAPPHGLRPEGARPGECYAKVLVPSQPPAFAPAHHDWIRVICEKDADIARVRHIQQRLHAWGVYQGGYDGRYDAATAGAVGRFQDRQGLADGGLLSVRTVDALDAVPPPPPPPQMVPPIAPPQAYAARSYAGEGYGQAYAAPAYPAPIYSAPPAFVQPPVYVQPAPPPVPIYPAPAYPAPVYATSSYPTPAPLTFAPPPPAFVPPAPCAAPACGAPPPCPASCYPPGLYGPGSYYGQPWVTPYQGFVTWPGKRLY